MKYLKFFKSLALENKKYTKVLFEKPSIEVMKYQAPSKDLTLKGPTILECTSWRIPVLLEVLFLGIPFLLCFPCKHNVHGMLLMLI